MELTLQQWIILIVVISLIVSLIVGLIKSSIRLALAGIIIFLLFSVFTWLPEQVEIWLNGGSTEEITINIEENVDKINDWVENDGQTWIQAGKDLWLKIIGQE